MGKISFTWKQDAKAFDAAGNRAESSAELAPLLLAFKTAEQGYLETLSGGTSGTPKRFRRSASSWCHSMNINATRFDISSQSELAVFGDLRYSLSLYAMAEAISIGANAHLLTNLGPKSCAAEINDRGISHIYATPSQIMAIAPQPLHDVRSVVLGGGRLSSVEFERARSLFPQADIHWFYGTAETSFVTLATLNDALNTVGATYPGVLLRSDDQNNLWIRSPMLADLIDGQPLELVDGWFCLPDQGAVNSDGALELWGRKDRAINLNDQTIYLDRLEAEIKSTVVQEFAIVDYLNAHGKTRLAFVATATIQSDLPAIISKRVVISELPKTQSGKIAISALRDMVQSQYA